MSQNRLLFQIFQEFPFVKSTNENKTYRKYRFSLPLFLLSHRLAKTCVSHIHVCSILVFSSSFFLSFGYSVRKVANHSKMVNICLFVLCVCVLVFFVSFMVNWLHMYEILSFKRNISTLLLNGRCIFG